MSAEVLNTELVPIGTDKLQVVRRTGQVWVPLAPACETLGIDHNGQRQRLNQQPWAQTCVIHVSEGNLRRQQFCLRSDRVAMWLAIDGVQMTVSVIRKEIEKVEE